MPESRPQLGAYLKREIKPALERMSYAMRIAQNPVGDAGAFLIGD